MSLSIRILATPSFAPQYANAVSSTLEKQFHANVFFSPFTFDLSKALDRSRGQYLSAAFIRQMQIMVPASGGEKLLGITDVDLYAPVLTFVFGEAQLGGECAILSTFRLRNEYYGIPEDPGTFQERLSKEAVHEIGHVYGLIHCRSFECVMRSSTYVEEIDLKSAELCRTCRAGLER